MSPIDCKRDWRSERDFLALDVSSSSRRQRRRGYESLRRSGPAAAEGDVTHIVFHRRKRTQGQEEVRWPQPTFARNANERSERSSVAALMRSNQK
ncbi:hypothetical protein MTO96_000805 [Rhipicephalus appendiculatus]